MKCGLTLTILMLALGSSMALLPAAATAGTEGGNPTRCAHDAEVVEQVPVTVALNGYAGQTFTAGYLQLRWSPSCQGNWARFIANKVIVNGSEWGYYGKVWVSGGVYKHTHSEKVNDFFAGSSLAFYTSMVWAPDPHCASAHVQLYDEQTEVIGPSAETRCY